MRYHFIQEHRSQWPTRLMCRTLEMSTGGYYDGPPGPLSNDARP